MYVTYASFLSCIFVVQAFGASNCQLTFALDASLTISKNRNWNRVEVAANELN